MGTPVGGTGFTPSQMSANSSGLAPAPKAAPAAPAPAAAPAAAPKAPEPVPMETAQAHIPALGADDSEAPALDAAVVDDDGEAPDPWAEDIHGMTAKDLLAAIKEGKLPDALLDALEHEIGDGEDKTSIKLRDALAQDSKERMQLANYHRELHKVRVKEQELAAQTEALQQSIAGLNNPESLYDDLTSLGVTEETLQAAAYAYAQQQVEYRKLPPHMRKILDDNKRARIEAAKVRQELQQFKQREMQSQSQASQQASQQAMRTHGLPALLKHGLNPKSKLVQEKLALAMDYVSQGKAWTRDMVYDAAEMTKQDMHMLERADKQATATGGRQPQGKPLAPTRAASPQPLKAPARAASGVKGFTPSALNKLRMG